jgi:hypothetical protein
MNSTTKNLNISLTIVQVFGGLYAFFGVVMLLGGAFFGRFAGERLGISGVASLVFPYIVLGLFLIVNGIWGIFLLNWIKEWQARVSEWTQGSRIDKFRLQAITSTLEGWISVSQWGPIVLTLFFTLIIFLSIATIRQLSSESGIPNIAAVAGAIAFAIPIFCAPGLVINWLILKNIRTWMLEVNRRITTRINTIDLMQQSNTISTWFVVFQVLLGLGVLRNLFFAGSSENGGFLVVLIAGAINVFYGFVLEWSKHFAQEVSAYADRHT